MATQATAARWVTSELAANGRRCEDVGLYPRPPALEKVSLRLRVVWTDSEGETVIADTTNAYRVAETHHPPTYYLRPQDIRMDFLQKSNKHSFCEWKGSATYWTLTPPSKATTVASRAWSYESPTAGFAPIRGYLAFYASANTSPDVGGWKCFVEGEAVEAQEGDFYGGWRTAEIVGKMKGGPGTWGW